MIRHARDFRYQALPFSHGSGLGTRLVLCDVYACVCVCVCMCDVGMLVVFVVIPTTLGLV